MTFIWDDTELDEGLEQYPGAVEEAVVAVMGIIAQTWESRAQSGHPWQNRTGAAEEGLNADVVRDAAEHVVTAYLQHGDDVPHGWYLEAAPGARGRDNPPTWEYSVIMPILETSYEPLMNELRRIFE